MAESSQKVPEDSSLVAFYQPLISKSFPLPCLAAPSRKTELEFQGVDEVSDVSLSEAVDLLGRVSKCSRPRKEHYQIGDGHALTKLQEAILSKNAAAFEPLLEETNLVEQNGYEDLPQSQQDYSHNHEASSEDKDAAPTVRVSTQKHQSADANVTFKLGRNRLEKACTPDTVGRQADGPSLPVPAAKRRRTASTGYLRTAEANTQASLESLRVDLEAFVNASRKADEETSDEDEDEDTGFGSPSKHAKRLHHLCLSLNQLHAHLHTLPDDLITSFLDTLLPLIEQGKQAEPGKDADVDCDVVREACMSLDAGTAALIVMSAANMPTQVLNEAVISPVAEAIKHHLFINVLSKHSAQIRNLHAQGQEKEVVAKLEGKKRRNKVSSAEARGPMDLLCSRLEQALKCLAKLLAAAHVDGALVLPSLRIAAETLLLEDLGLLQLAAIDFLAAAFHRYESQQDVMFADIFNTILPNLITKGSGHKSASKSSAHLQPVTILLLKIVQESVSLPQLDAQDSWSTAFVPAVRLADSFWHLCFERLPTSKALKADKDLDYKAVIESIVSDLLSALRQPEYPGAPVILLRFQRTLGSPLGLQHPDGQVRQMCVDHLSFFGKSLFALGQIGDALLSKWEISNDAQADIPRHLQRLLDYLEVSELDQEARASARRYILCQNFASRAGANEKDPAKDSSALDTSLTTHWHALDTSFETPSLSREEASELALTSNLRLLKLARFQMLKWLQEVLENKDNGPQIRAKAIKALSEWAQVDVTMLSRPQIAGCFQKALGDDSASVRQESLSLLGAHLKRSKDLAVSCFDLLATCLKDSSPAVRKAALKIIWEACVVAKDCPKTVEACHLILQRAHENEDASANVAVKFIHSLWFSPYSEAGEEQDIDGRAEQLAAVAFAMRCEELKPMDAASPLVCFLTKALEVEAKSDPSLKNGRELAETLLESFISTQNSDEQQRLPYLLALNALALSNPALCVPPKSQTSFFRKLAPYLKPSSTPEKEKSAETRRAEAETLICLMTSLSAVLKQLTGTIVPQMLEVEVDLLQVVKRHGYLAVVNTACHMMHSLHSVDDQVGSDTTQVASFFLAKIREFRHNSAPDFSDKNALSMCQRMLIGLGFILRHCAEMVESWAERPEYQGQEISCQSAFQECLELTLQHDMHPKVQEYAFKSLGQIGTARPNLLMRTQSRTLISRALKDARNFALKRAALSILLDLLNADASSLNQAQKNKEKGKKKQTKKGGKASAHVPCQNGESDDLFAGSSLLQENMAQVRLLAVEVTGCPTSSPGHRPCEETRHIALQILEAVERNGIMPPFELIPTLVALVTDPSRAFPNSALALRLLKHIAGQHAEFVSRHIGEGLSAASNFQASLAGQFSNTPAKHSLTLPAAAIGGFVRLYSEVMCMQRSLRVGFVTALIRPQCERACDPENVKPKSLGLVQFGAQIAAALPLKKMYEVFALLHPIHSIIRQHGLTAMASLKAGVKALEEEGSEPRDLKAGKAVDRAIQSSLALVTLLMLSNILSGKFGMRADRLAALENSADCRKKEENKDVQIHEDCELRMDELASLTTEQGVKHRDLYSAVKCLMQSFNTTHSALNHAAGVAVEAGEAKASPEGPSPQGKDTPQWAKSNAELARVNSARSNGLNRTGSTGSGQRRARAQTRKSSLSNLGQTGSGRKGRGKRKKVKSESEDEEDNDDGEGEYRPKKAAHRRRLDRELSED